MISSFPLILQNDISINELNIIDQCNIKHSIMLLIKTKTSVLIVIIISIEAQPAGLSAILMINSVSAFKNTIILYICTYIDVFLCLTIHVSFRFRSEGVRVAVCLPPGAEFVLTGMYPTKYKFSSWTNVTSVSEVDDIAEYFFDPDTGYDLNISYTLFIYFETCVNQISL